MARLGFLGDVLVYLFIFILEVQTFAKAVDAAYIYGCCGEYVYRCRYQWHREVVQNK